MSQYTIQSDNIFPAAIKGAVSVHRQEIGQGFLSSLGDKALYLIFSLASDSRSGILLVARDEAQDSVCGFLLGTLDTGAFYREFLYRKSLSAAIVLLPKMLSLERIRKVIETLLYPARSDVPNLPAAELLDIAVAADQQGTGLAQRLFHEFVSLAWQRGVQEFRITTGEQLVRAQRFYEKLGASKVATIEVHRGQATVVYIYTIPDTLTTS